MYKNQPNYATKSAEDRLYPIWNPIRSSLPYSSSLFLFDSNYISALSTCFPFCSIYIWYIDPAFSIYSIPFTHYKNSSHTIFVFSSSFSTNNPSHVKANLLSSAPLRTHFTDRHMWPSHQPIARSRNFLKDVDFNLRKLRTSLSLLTLIFCIFFLIALLAPSLRQLRFPKISHTVLSNCTTFNEYHY